MGFKTESDSLLEGEDAVSSEPSLFNVVRIAVLAGGVYVCGFAPTALIVFTGPKIAHDPVGFTTVEISLCQTLFWLGWALASATLMPLSDLVGRRTVMYPLLAVGLVATFITTRAMHLWLYGAAQFVVGFTLPPSAILGYLLTNESLPAPWRPTMTVCLTTSASLFNVFMALSCAMTVNWDWRVEILLWHCPLAALLLIGPFFVKESRAASSSLAARSDSTVDVAETPLHQLSRAPFLTCMMATSMCWVAASVSYYGLNYAAGKLSRNIHMNFAMMATVDICGHALAGPLMAHFNPIWTQMGAFSGAAMALISCSVMMPDSSEMVAAALVGRLCIEVAFTTIYVLVVECFPEQCRSTAMGIANFVARCGTLVAPLCSLVETTVSCPVLGMVCFVAAVSTLELRRSKQTK